MGEAYLLRAYADTATVGYYSPLHGDCASLLPIPEPGLRLGEEPPWLSPSAAEPCSGLSYEAFMPLGGEWVLHRDPRLDLRPAFYTEPLGRRGRTPSRLGPGDVLVFVAGLARYPRGFWLERRRRGEILRAFKEARSRGEASIYVVGLLFIEDVLVVRRWPPPGAPGSLALSPHAAVGEPARAFIGRGVSLEPPAPVEALAGAGLWAAGRLRALARGRFRAGSLGDAEDVLSALGV